MIGYLVGNLRSPATCKKLSLFQTQLIMPVCVLGECISRTLAHHLLGSAQQMRFNHQHCGCAQTHESRVCAVAAPCSVHEVYIDDDQMAWFGSVLEQNTQRPIIIFTHAPPMGSGLKVVQNVHVKNRCAWLNHSDR